MKIALVGYDIEGQASYRYFAHDKNEIVIFDEADQPGAITPEGVEVVSGSTALSELKKRNFDKVIRTPGLSPRKLHGIPHVTTATREFFIHCPAIIIGVTGTKGKGTTCSLISEILTLAGKKVWLVGNIGSPALDVLSRIQAGDIVVYELSSFQLWDLEVSPKVAVVLMIEADHLDVHADFNEYLQAKTNITIHQTTNDTVVYHPTNKYSQAIAKHSPAAIKKKFLTPEGAYIDAETVVIAGQNICSVKEIGLKGKFNLENVCAAITAAWEYTKNMTAIAAAVKEFKGLEHRLEHVRTLKGIEFYNSSMSTTPGAAIVTIQSFDNPEILIMGGYDRHNDFTQLAKEINKAPNIKKILLIGQTKNDIAKALKEAGVEKYEIMPEAGELVEIVDKAYSLAQAGDVILLNPACPSFDMFKNFSERGNQFKKAVGELV